MLTAEVHDDVSECSTFSLWKLFVLQKDVDLEL